MISIKKICFIITSSKTKFKTCWLPWKIPNSLELDPIKFFLSPMDFESLIVTCTYKNYWYTTNTTVYIYWLCVDTYPLPVTLHKYSAVCEVMRL